jgi:ribosomal-protein-alanine N-acetyltransferase
MAEVLLREMRKDYIPDMLKIERLCFTTPWTETAFLNELHKPYAISRIALLNNKLVGYACANFVLNEAHILNLAVHPEYRRRKIGTALMYDMMNLLKKKGCRFLFLEVRVSSFGARKFYEHFGFKVVGLRKDYYPSPKEDAALMMRII